MTDETVEQFGRAHAERAARKIAKLEREAETELAPFRAEIERLQRVVDDRRRVVDNATAYEKIALQHWHREAVDCGEAKTQRFPYGVSTMRAASVKVSATSEFVDWALENRPDLLSVSADHKAIRDACSNFVKTEMGQPCSVADPPTDDGEPLPGVVLHRSDPSHTFKPELDVLAPIIALDTDNEGPR